MTKKKKRSKKDAEIEKMQSMLEHLIVVANWLRVSSVSDENVMALRILFKSADFIMHAAMLNPSIVAENVLKLRESVIESMLMDQEYDPKF